MSRFRKIAALCIIMELLMVLGFNILAVSFKSGDNEKLYLVEIKRVKDELNKGTSPEEIELSNYESIASIREYNPEENNTEDYKVVQVKDKLYRIDYKASEVKDWLVIANLFMIGVVVISLLVFLFVYKKLIKPFHDINKLPKELAKGNLANPIKAEKGKYFGDFLWGMDLLHEKLEQDKIRELELLRDKKTLVLSLSHDIKTPISASNLYIKALQNGLYETEEERSEALEGIRRNLDEINKYVSEIVKASREDVVSLVVNNQEFYLSEAIEFVKKYYRNKMEQNHTRFLVQVGYECLAYGDRDRLVEVLQNAIENALKYGDGQEISLDFSEEEDCKLITVCNSGSTLKPEELAHIFDSFYRGSNSEAVPGSGMGLYICKEIMHRMNGDIFAKLSGNKFLVTIVVKKL